MKGRSMRDTITIFAESIEDIAPSGSELEVTLAGVDVKRMVSDIPPPDILDEMNIDDIKEYLENRDQQ